jgi:signal transduction histidine kinase
MLSIYAVGLAQLLVAAGAIFAMDRLLQRAPYEHEPARARGLILAMAEMFDHPDELRRAVARIDAEHTLDLSFYLPDGTPVATTDPALPALDEAQATRLSENLALTLPGERPPTTAIAIQRDGRMVGYGLTRIRRRPGGASGARRRPMTPLDLSPTREPFGIAVALVGMALVALLFARRLGKPLAHLANAARAFGAGDLNARARLDRRDEIGAVARTFDEMAERVNLLLRTQREFLGNVAHELRTPLARIRVALDIAAEGNAEAARQSIDDIAGDWTDLDRLVEGLLVIARMDLARDPSVPAAALRLEPVDARELVERVAVGFRALHPRHALEVSTPPQATTVRADATLLRRVLDNLLENAAHYSDETTPVRLVVSAVDDGVVFSVIDRGEGIDEAHLPRLFEPFFRSDPSRARRTGGVGLGLALARRIVDAHGGRISVESRVGEGTTFTFTIPSNTIGGPS